MNDERHNSELGVGGGQAVPSYTEELGTRISLAIERIGGVRAAAKFTGTTEDTLANWRDGRARPSFFGMQGLANAAKVRFEWLATGVEPMSVREDTSDADADREREHHGVKKPENALPDGMSPAYLRDLVVDAVQAVEEWLDERNATLSPEKKAKVVGALVEDLLERGPDTGNVDLRSVASRMLRLVA